jgi:hypothetical protein
MLAAGFLLYLLLCADGPDVLAPAENLITWKRGDAVRVRMADSGFGALQPVSTMTHLRQSAERAPNKPALGKILT